MQGIQQNRDSLKLCCWVRWLEHSGASLIFMILSDTAAIAFCCIICFHMYSVDVWNEVLEYLVQTWRLRLGNSEVGVLLGMGKVPMEGQWVTELSRDKKQTTFEPETSGKDSALSPLIWLAIANVSLDYLHAHHELLLNLRNFYKHYWKIECLLEWHKKVTEASGAAQPASPTQGQQSCCPLQLAEGCGL